MPYRIAICDDNAIDTKYVAGLLAAWAGKRALSLQIEEFPSAEAFFFRYTEEKAFDVLLLDIEMGGMDGVTMAKKVRRENETVQIVFITGYSEYIAEGYEVAALHYLVKPIKEGKLFEVMDRAWEKRKQNERCLNLELSGEMVRIPFYEIRYLQVWQNYVTVYGKQEYTIKRPLREFEALLDERFHRVGRSLLVNVSYIRRVTKSELVLADGTVLPVPRGAYEALNRAIIAYS